MRLTYRTHLGNSMHFIYINIVSGVCGAIVLLSVSITRATAGPNKIVQP